MISGKKISAWWNSLLCFLFGHSLTYVCNRCGKIVNLENTVPSTLEERINALFDRKKKKEANYVGSIRIKPGLQKYELNLAKNTLRLVETQDEVIGTGDKTKIKHKAAYNPCCVYLDALKDEIALSKANKYLFGIKRGVVIKEISK